MLCWLSMICEICRILKRFDCNLVCKLHNNNIFWEGSASRDNLAISNVHVSMLCNKVPKKVGEGFNFDYVNKSYCIMLHNKYVDSRRPLIDSLRFLEQVGHETMYLLEISIFSLNHVIVRPTKMFWKLYLLKDYKVGTFKNQRNHCDFFLWRMLDQKINF